MIKKILCWIGVITILILSWNFWDFYNDWWYWLIMFVSLTFVILPLFEKEEEDDISSA